MQTISLNSQTIAAIANVVNGEVSVSQKCETFEGEVRQGNVLVVFQYNILADWREEMNVHTEVPYGRTEYLSGYDRTGFELTDISAWDEDGEQLRIANQDTLIQAIS